MKSFLGLARSLILDMSVDHQKVAMGSFKLIVYWGNWHCSWQMLSYAIQFMNYFADIVALKTISNPDTGRDEFDPIQYLQSSDRLKAFSKFHGKAASCVIRRSY
jgi:hypothetical protein